MSKAACCSICDIWQRAKRVVCRFSRVFCKSACSSLIWFSSRYRARHQYIYCVCTLSRCYQIDSCWDVSSTSRSVLEPLAQWDSPMQVKLSCWKLGLNTLLVELLPWALLANHSQWDLWLFEGETIVLQVPAGKVIVPPNFKVGRLGYRH